TAAKYGGTGLGMTITKRLTEMMKGSIGVTSEVGQGTTFTLLLPRIISP
ncbi:MAG: ATP-binding protein, partial [Verrucomicrobiota bacterium]|nr:ATP-binding protein [Verrucomicrobiota bacterium]MEC7235688.1 ATP-binding protein [Verrucomicrobiota bacterium]